jgi:acetylornithine/succinyldiaminopimelate/putrescine aminotransferase
VLEEVPKLLEHVKLLSERFAAAGWDGAGLMRTRRGDADRALQNGVLVVPAGVDGGLVQATPALTITDEELDEALARLARV